MHRRGSSDFTIAATALELGPRLPEEKAGPGQRGTRACRSARAALALRCTYRLGWLGIGFAAACFDPAPLVTPSEPTCPLAERSSAARFADGPAPIDDDDAGLEGESLVRLVRFAVIGDDGLDGPNEARVAALVASWNPDFVITTGDNNYFEGAASTIDANIGKHYCQFIGNYRGKPGEGSRENRFWPSPGNHDWVAPNLKPYLDYFTLPGNERYYHVDRGLVHLYSLDSDFNEIDGNTPESGQAAWLKSALAESRSCFDIVYFHHPPFTSGPHGSSFEMRWPFEEWGAEAVMAGHDHTYERLEVGQIPYFTVGLGGSSIYDFVTVLPETRMQYRDDYGALRATADPHGITFEFVNVSGTVVDTFRFAKDCPVAERGR